MGDLCLLKLRPACREAAIEHEDTIFIPPLKLAYDREDDVGEALHDREEKDGLSSVVRRRLTIKDSEASIRPSPCETVKEALGPPQWGEEK